MQRNMDLLREILLRIEALEIPPGAHAITGVQELEIDGDDSLVFDNLRMAVDGGLIDTVRGFGQDGRIGIRGLSWEGAEFLDKVRQPENWAAAKGAAAKVGSFSIDVIKAAASAMIADKMKAAGL